MSIGLDEGVNTQVNSQAPKRSAKMNNMSTIIKKANLATRLLDCRKDGLPLTYLLDEYELIFNGPPWDTGPKLLVLNK